MITRRIMTLGIPLVFSLISISCSETVVGDWTGTIDVQETKLRFNFHVSKTGNNYSTTIDVPAQGAKDIKTTSTAFENNELTIIVESMEMEYKGMFKDGVISGTYTQRGSSFPLNLKPISKDVVNGKVRPQDPKEPFPYISEEVQFINTKAKNIKLAGTLTLPRGVDNPPVAILITGTGAQDRNEEIFNHRPFLVLSDYLTRNGIAVLRYDDRGVGESEGTLRGTNSSDLATDVEAAIKLLKNRNDVNTKKIGLIGHSEGGLIAPMVASKNSAIAFIVSLAGTGADGLALLLSQERRKAELRGVSDDEIDFNERILKRVFTIVKEENDFSKIHESVQKDLELFRNENVNDPYINTLTDTEIAANARGASNPKNIYFFKTDPKQFWTKVQCPVLVVNGDKDSQVLSKTCHKRSFGERRQYKGYY